MFVLNVSSPNTPGLRDLQNEDLLQNVLRECTKIREKNNSNKPLLLKLSPDNDDELIYEMADISKNLD